MTLGEGEGSGQGAAHRPSMARGAGHRVEGPMGLALGGEVLFPQCLGGLWGRAVKQMMGGAPWGPVVFVGELEPSGREPCPPASCDEDTPAGSGVGGQGGHALGPDGPDLQTEICLRGSGRWAACVCHLGVCAPQSDISALSGEGRSLWNERNACFIAQKEYGRH